MERINKDRIPLYYNSVEEMDRPMSELIEELRLEIDSTRGKLHDIVVSGSAIKPPLGLIPKKFHDERVKVERFNEVCGVIARYYDAGLKINIEWVEEYNELVECVGKHYR
jgi:hypothetical protein